MYAVLCGYLAGWIVTSVALAIASRRLNSKAGPGSHLVAVAAGAAWPLLIVGAAQLAVVALVAAIVRRRASRHASISEREIDELVERLLDTADAGTHGDFIAR